MSKVTNIGSRIHSVERGNVVAGANEILDDAKGKKQNVINADVDAELLRLDQSKQNNLTFDNTPTENSTNPVTSGGVYAANITIHELIEAILVLIPSAASALNQLADKAFVNSSVSTATATFRGTYNVVTDLELAYDANHEQIATKLGQVIATADNNDYAFVQVPVSATSTDIRRTERYKFNGTVWGYEYDLNTSGFTAVQWEAINSGITALLVSKLTNLPTAEVLASMFAAKQNVLTFDAAPTALSTNPVYSGGVYAAIKAITDLIPEEATALNQLADKAYVLASILAATPAFKGQFTSLADLLVVASPKAGDLGIVRTKDSDGYDVFTFYQYLNNQWNVFYTLSHHLLNKPATTGTTGAYPYNGMGRVVIPKKMVDDVNTLTHEAFEDSEGNDRENTIYIIQYDFTLDTNITVPANCVLEFDGGSLNGSNKITFYDTKLSGNPKVLCDFEGNISNGELNISWFGITSSTISQQNRFQKVIDLYTSNVSTSSWDMHMDNPEPKIIIPNGRYNFGNITLRSFLHIQGAGRAGTELWHTHLKGSGIYNVKLSDFTLTGDKSKDNSIDIEDVVNGATATGVKDFSEDYSIGLYLVGGARYIFNNVCIQNYDICFCGDEAYSAEWYSCFLSYCTIGFLNYGCNGGHAGHNVHFIGGEINNYKYGFVQNDGNSVAIDDSCIEGGTYGVYVRVAGLLNVERTYFEGNTYDIWANGKQTKIINNFFGEADKPADSYYIYLNETQADVISGNFFGNRKTNNHICVNTIYLSPYIFNNFVNGSNPLTLDDGLYGNIDYGRIVSGDGILSFNEVQNPAFANRMLAITNTYGKTICVRGIETIKASIPKVIGEWSIYDAANALDSDCVGLDIYYPYFGKPAWFDGNKFVDANGYTLGHSTKTYGATSDRPTELKSTDIGFRYFDTTLGKPIYVKSVDETTTPATITWVNATGTPE